VCQDFSLLAPVLDYVLPVLLLVGGVVAYARQKEIDRKNNLLAEKSEIFRAYLEALCDDIGYHSDGQIGSNPELRAKQRYRVTRLRMRAVVVASRDELKKIHAIADAREGGKPLVAYADEIIRFAQMVRGENSALNVEHIPFEEFRQYVPFSTEKGDERAADLQ